MPTKSDQTRQNILDAAYELFLSQGYSATSMREIAEKANIALGGIYNHFASKDEIFQEVIIARHPYLTIMPLIQNAPGKTVEELLRNAARIIQDEMGPNPDFMKLMLIEIVEFNGKHFPKLFAIVSPHVLPLLLRITQLEKGLRDLPLPLILRSLMGMIAAFYISESLMQDSKLPAQIRNVKLEDFIDIYLHGILECRSQNEE